MRYVPFDPETLPPDLKTVWDAWVVRSNAARDELTSTFSLDDPPKAENFKEGVWGDLKDFLMAHVFMKRCAYCEARVDPTGWGDAEHWRPKGKITVREADGSTRVICTRGYYWLAYDWRNLVVACSQCNSVGKANHFPVAGTHHCGSGPGPLPTIEELDAMEQPELLHPYVDQHPEEHLTFDQTGSVVALTPRGSTSLRTFNLNREGLVEARFEVQDLAWKRVHFAMGVSGAAVKTEIDRILNGPGSFPAAALAYVKAKFAEVVPAFPPGG
jgi:hypothetical protein